ncbi:MAG: class I SAM-dependent methyltransferase, partial [Bacteroidota bacterium]|nr:class I SAM-dependent methyltransferase [Bacteroidota bacterium]
MYNVEQLGQVFTPLIIVSQMLTLRKNSGKVLEPSCGDGAFFNNIPSCVGIELDKTHCPKGALNMDFFDYPISEKFDTIIGNPPYVRYQDINPQIKAKLKSNLFDERSNLYLFFIEKCLKHLEHNGELIFITPRDFLKATSSIKLNEYIFSSGTITDIIDLGDSRIFKGFTLNCIIFRFEKDNFTRHT